MTTHPERAARLADVETQIAYYRKKMQELETRRLRVAEQAGGAINVLAKTYDATRRAGVEQELRDIDRQLTEFADELPYLTNEARELRHQVQAQDAVLQNARRMLAEVPDLFTNPLTWMPEHWPNSDLMRWHRERIVAAERLRAAGEAVPDTITIVLSLAPMHQPIRPLPPVVPDEEAIEEAVDEAVEVE